MISRVQSCKIPVPKGKTVTAKYYRDVALRKLKKVYKRRRPQTGLKYLRLLHDNAPAHKACIVTEFLESEKVKVLHHPPYSPDLAPSDLHLFGPLQAFTKGTKFESDDEVKSVVSDWLRHQSKDFYAEGIQKLLHRWERCVTVLGDFDEKF